MPFPDPVAIYPLNGKSGGKDIGPKSYSDAQLMYLQTAEGPYGEPAGSYELDGDFIEIPNGGNLDTKYSTSILLWVYHEGQAGPILDYEDSNTFNLWLSQKGGFTVQFGGRDKQAANLQKTGSVSSKTWHHVAVVYNYKTGMASVWLNGSLAIEADIGQKELGTDSTVVRMGTLDGVDELFIGRVSCLQFYDVALTGEQIAALMDTCKGDAGRRVKLACLLLVVNECLLLLLLDLCLFGLNVS